MSSSHTREELIYLAKLAEQCERYDGKCLCLSIRSRSCTYLLVSNNDRKNRESRAVPIDDILNLKLQRSGANQSVVCFRRDGKLFDPVRQVW